MKKTIFPALVICAALVVVAAFFMPWANVQTSVTAISEGVLNEAKDVPLGGKITSGISKATNFLGALGDVEIKTVVRGSNIPSLVNSNTSKVALSLAEILFKSVEGLDWKSYLVYLIPLFAIICAGLAVLAIKKALYIIPIIAIGAVIFYEGIYNIKTADLSHVVVKITIEKGLWLTLYAFLFMALTAAAWLFIERKNITTR
jgi:hypothetical protein